MNITNNYSPYQPKTDGVIPKKLLEPIKDTKVSKNLTPLDVAAFNTYVNSRQYRMGITPQEVENLKKLDGDEFLLESYKLIINKMGVPEDLAPIINVVDQIPGEGEMAYESTLNMIYCDKSKMVNNSKSENFYLLRHECQHYLQNASILRHETFGEKAIDILTANYAAMEKNTATALLNTYTDEQLSEIFTDTPETIDYMSKARKLLQDGNEEDFNNLFSKESEDYKSNLLELQNNLRTKMGVIKNDSPLTPKVEKYFEELYHCGYYKNSSLEVDHAKYHNSTIEQEAISAQAPAGYEFNYDTCPTKWIKQQIELLYEDRDLVQKIRNDFKENNIVTNL